MIRQTIKGRLLHDIKNRGVSAWITAAALLAFYVALYMDNSPFDPVAQSIGLYNKWFLYGALYTVAIVVGGLYMWKKYGHNRYQVIRIAVVIAVQVVFAFVIPLMMKAAQKPDYYFSYIWPLKIEYFYPSTIAYQLEGGLPIPVVFYSLFAGLIMAPVLGIFFGKRWYCGWICGCGGLANTLGEPWRHLSQKSHTAWRFEKATIHTVLVVAIVATGLSVASVLVGPERYPALAKAGSDFRYWYGWIVGAGLSGAAGVALYPIGGTRIWCRYFCPMAALLGLVQKFGRFRIRVKDDMCISCGLCSKYCEMGIDVRAYAQANTSFTRASCVGCGLCSEVCPRGVLRLENVDRRDPQELGFASPQHIELWKGPNKATATRH